jgi:hypothetical protein
MLAKSTFKADSLSLKPHLQSLSLWLFWRWGLLNYLHRQASNHNPPNLSPKAIEAQLFSFPLLSSSLCVEWPANVSSIILEHRGQTFSKFNLAPLSTLPNFYYYVCPYAVSATNFIHDYKFYNQTFVKVTHIYLTTSVCWDSEYRLAGPLLRTGLGCEMKV